MLLKSRKTFLLTLDPLKQISADLNRANDNNNNNNNNNNNYNNYNNKIIKNIIIKKIIVIILMAIIMICRIPENIKILEVQKCLKNTQEEIYPSL